MSEGYAALFLSAFLAASILPFSSEALLGGMMVSDRFDQVWLLVVASTGNTLGAVVNWALGRFFIHFRDRRWFPVKAAELERATNGFNRYGSWSLLFAWVPVVPGRRHSPGTSGDVPGPGRHWKDSAICGHHRHYRPFLTRLGQRNRCVTLSRASGENFESGIPFWLEP